MYGYIYSVLGRELNEDQTITSLMSLFTHNLAILRAHIFTQFLVSHWVPQLVTLHMKRQQSERCNENIELCDGRQLGHIVEA